MDIAIYNKCKSRKNEVEKLAGFVTNFYINQKESVKVNCYFDLEKLYQDTKRFDFSLIFIGGFDTKNEIIFTSNYIWQSGFGNKLVIISENIKHATLGYSVNAFGFLLNPISQNDILEILNRELSERKRFIAFSKRKSIVSLKYQQILYIESNNNFCEVHTLNGVIQVNEKISVLSEKLKYPFLKCHRGYIVNMNYVTSVDKDFTLINGKKIFITQRELRTIKCTFYDYVSPYEL